MQSSPKKAPHPSKSRMTTVEVFAPAKINLALHVTGQREDGYHLLDSLVAFAPVGDRITIGPGDGLSLTVDGPEAAGVPADETNLVIKAAGLLSRGRGAAIRLTKGLPAASGMGGGSADAAATLRGLLAVWFDDDEAEALADAPDPVLDEMFRNLPALGADLPMCLQSQTCRAQGIGEQLTFLTLPPLPAVLVNPRVPVSTPAVFRALDQRRNPGLPDTIPSFRNAAQVTDWLADQRNDLEVAAGSVVPEIWEVLDAIAVTKGCRLARMSGSGATCFGLYPDEQAAALAEKSIAEAHPGWWVAAGYLGSWGDRAQPRILAR